MLGQFEDYGGDYGDFYYDDYYYPEYAYDDYGSIGGGYTPGIDYAPYEPMDLNPPSDPNLPDLPTFGNDVWYVPPEYSTDIYSQFMDWFGPVDYFADPLENILTSEQGLPPISNIDWQVPYQGYLPPFETPPYVPYEPPAPAPPDLPQSPATQQSNLPPACPPGYYHPFPIGHPQQNACVAFPSQQTQQPQRPQPQSSPGSGSSGGSSSGGSKPSPNQSCASGFCKHPTTGQCIPTPLGYYRDPSSQVCKPIPAQQQQPQACPQGYYRASNGQCAPIPRCTTPGTVFDVRSGRCVPYAQASQPACPAGYWLNTQTKTCEPIPNCAPGLLFDTQRGVCVQPSELSGDVLDSLKNIPWWLWGLGLFLLLSQGKDESGRTTTVKYRRAS